MSETMTPELRLERLRRLWDVVDLHRQSSGRPVKLNGEIRGWNMLNWNCESAACAQGSYALTPYGQKYFKINEISGTPRLREDSRGATIDDASAHFGILIDEAEYLFLPDSYDYYDNNRSWSNDPVTPAEVLEHISEIIDKYK